MKNIQIFALLIFGLESSNAFYSEYNVSSNHLVKFDIESDDWKNVKLLHFLLGIKIVQNYNTLLVANCKDIDGIDDRILMELKIPITLMTLQKDNVYWRSRYNSELLVYLCLDNNVDRGFELLSYMASYLQHIRETRLLLHLTTNDEDTVIDYLEYCIKLDILNVIALCSNFQHTNTVYAFDRFPTFHLRSYGLMHQHEYFPNKIKNLYGHSLLTIPDQNAPRSFVYNDHQGDVKLSGYVGKLVLTFIEVINGTLIFPSSVEIGKSVYITDLENYTKAGFIDLVTGLGTPSTYYTFNDYTNVVDFSNWMPMLPVESYLEVHDMHILILHSAAVLYTVLLAILLSVLWAAFRYEVFLLGTAKYNFWLDIVFNDKYLRGILAQSFPMEKTTNFRIACILSMIFLLGFTVNSLYSAYLNSFLTHPPTKPPISTFDELLASDLKILFAREEIRFLLVIPGLEFWERYKSTFEVIESWSEFLRRRKSLNTSHAYPLTTMLWTVIEQQQQRFQRKLFRINYNMVFEEAIRFCIPIQENSVYKPMFNRFITYAHEAGLVDHWRTLTFFDMVACGEISPNDTSILRSYKSLSIEDFSGILMTYTAGILLSCLIFACEIIVFRIISDM